MKVLSMPRLTCCLVMVAGWIALPARAADSSAAPLTFESHVRPILKAYCFDCHGEGDKLKGDLDLRLSRLILEGGSSGPVVLAGKPDASLLYQRVKTAKMPPGKKKLSLEQIEIIGRWIAGGARVERREPEKVAAGMLITAEDRAFWAFQPVRRPPVPTVQAANRVRTPIDAFLLAQLQAKNLTFAPDADKRTLIRRATVDLLGLPPTPEDVDAFLADGAPGDYERLIDRLLASPRYGERWGRHWLDVAGYADSEGFTQQDTVRASAYKYRDYVIRSFNADKPFDRFIQEQLAGDEMIRFAGSAPGALAKLSPDDLDQLIATGFLRMAPDGTAAGDVDQKNARNQVVADTIKIISTTLLGLSVGCAQCHNHRYDPIPQTDYYRMRSILEPAYDVQKWRTPAAREMSSLTPADRQQAKQIEAEAVKIDQERLKKQQQFIDATFDKELAKVPEDLRAQVRAAWKQLDARRNVAQKKLLKDYPTVNVTKDSLYLYDSKAADELKVLAAKADTVRATKPVDDSVRCLTEVPGQVPTTFLFHRGDPDQPKQPILPGGLTILDEQLPLKVVDKDPSRPTTGRRLAYARWLTDGHHPLTGRVLVNRVWMHHFGRGLVGTPADFGKLGERPSHPELLDWLAKELVESGWSLKQLHRLMMTSTAYRQSARRIPTQERVDPDNRLLGRMNVRRLEAEAIRDSVLAVSGALFGKPFGKPVPVKDNEVGQIVLGIENKDGAGRFTAEIPLPPGEALRRSVYVQVRRSRPLGVLDTFDWATAEPNCEARNASTVTPQALLLMNGDFIVEQSEMFAARLAQDAGAEVKAQVVRAWQLAFAVEPSQKQVQRAVDFIAEQTAHFRAQPPSKPAKPAKTAALTPDQRALAVFCQALLSANRFLYVD
jgi:mono/diheme cytochrome c family protein